MTPARTVSGHVSGQPGPALMGSTAASAPLILAASYAHSFMRSLLCGIVDTASACDRGPAPGAVADGRTERLSERELDVVRLVAQGLSNAEIAARLYLSETTVKSHITRILAKLDQRDRVQVAVYAYAHGIVRPGQGTK